MEYGDYSGFELEKAARLVPPFRENLEMLSMFDPIN
jgi:hypothetical protein